MTRKVFVLGMDGADWYFVNKGISKGVLPSFEEIVNDGASGTLESLPPLTAPAWSTITTGREIRNHGIAGFSWRDYEYNVRLVSARDKKAKDLWEYISGKSIVINVPLTYPVKKINGIIVGGMLSPTLNEMSVYPPSEIKVLKDYGYVIEPKPTPKCIKESLDIRAEIVKHYFRKDWRLFFVVFREFDTMQHNFWKRGLSLYKRIDSLLGWVLEHMDPKTNLFIISDHGFNRVEKVFVTENWLKEEGYLRFVGDNCNGRAHLPSRGFYPLLISLKRFAEKWNISNLPLVREIIDYFCEKEREKLWNTSFDFSKTSVIYGLWNELFINSKDKFSKGFVDPEDLPKIREKIKTALLDLTDEKGIKIIDYVRTKNDLGATHLKKVPDVIFFVNSERGYTAAASARFTDKVIISAKKLKKEGEHTKNAIFMAYGPNIRKGSKLGEGRRLVDFTPTILYILGCSVKNKLDGGIMHEVLSD